MLPRPPPRGAFARSCCMSEDLIESPAIVARTERARNPADHLDLSPARAPCGGLDGRRCYIVTSAPRSICASDHAHARSTPAPPPSSRTGPPAGLDFAVDPAHVGSAAAGDCRRADRAAVGRRLLGDEDVSR